jgi:small-conductance mechanosensitive channel
MHESTWHFCAFIYLKQRLILFHAPRNLLTVLLDELVKLNKFNDVVGSWTRNLPSCSTVLQQTTIAYLPISAYLLIVLLDELVKLKKCNDLVESWTHNLQSCSIVPQQTTIAYLPILGNWSRALKSTYYVVTVSVGAVFFLSLWDWKVMAFLYGYKKHVCFICEQDSFHKKL